MLDRTRLSRHSLYPTVVTVAEAVYTDARADINIFFAVLAIRGHALAAFQRDIIPAVGVHYVF